MAFLIHPIVMLFIFDKFYYLDNSGIGLILISLTALIVLIYMLSIVLTLFFELPIITLGEYLTKIMFQTKLEISNIKDK